MNFILNENTPLDNKKVLLRVDFNVPMKNGEIEDPARIVASIPTIQLLLKKGCSIVLISHLGNPKGKYEPSLSLKPVAHFLSEKLKCSIKFHPYSESKIHIEEIRALSDQIQLLDNLRFFAAEEDPSLDPSFAKALAQLGEFYVDDAFACAHREHSSIVTVCKYFPKKTYLGLLMAKELKALNALYLKPKKPYLAILGGAKVSSKIKVIESLLSKVDALMIGGGMSIPFLKAKNKQFFSPLADQESIELAKKIMILAESKGVNLYLPTDLVVSKSKTSSEFRSVTVESGSFEEESPVDIGQETINFFSSIIPNYQTIFWNGPMGVFEVKPFDKGTDWIAKAISNHPCFSVIGGGDSAYAVEKLGYKDKFSHVSTGGGASIEFLEKGSLPGIDAVQRAQIN